MGRAVVALVTLLLVPTGACRRYEVGDVDAGPGMQAVDAADPDADAAVVRVPDAGASVCPTRYGATVVEVAVGGTGNKATDPERAEGPPNCGFGGGGSRSLSLGGGYIVLDIGCSYTPGASADLRVWEASPSYPPCYGVAERYDVEVSADGDTYTDLGEGTGPTAFNVTALESFRFVRISDPVAPDDSITPGADVDALELLHAP